MTSFVKFLLRAFFCLLFSGSRRDFSILWKEGAGWEQEKTSNVGGAMTGKALCAMESVASGVIDN